MFHDQEIVFDYDTIVVGGGITGLIIARELGKKNLKVLLIEATNRFGGKIYDQSFESNPNEYFPLGAFKFDSSLHKLLIKELNFYQLSYRQVSLFNKSFIRSRYLGLISWEEWFESLQQDSEYHRIIQQINQDSLEINPLEGFPYQLTNEHFDISLFDYLTKRLSLQEYLFEYFAYECSMHFGADLNLITTLQFLNMVKYFENVEKMFLFHHKYEQLTHPKGFSALIDSILQDIQQNLPNVTLLLNTPVISISSHIQNKNTRSFPPNYDYPESLALLPNYFISMKKVDGSYLHAKGIIVTIPLNSIFSIEFTPSLSQSLIKAVQICDCNRDFIQLFAHVNGISRRVDRIINFAADSPVWESQVLYRPQKETNKEDSSSDNHSKSVISIVGRRREILANPYKWFKDNHPDIQFTQFPTSFMRESLSRQSPTRIIGKHMSKAQEEECLQSSINDLQFDLLYHDWLSDPWTRSSYFNLRKGLRETFQIALDEVKHPWGNDLGDGKSSGGYQNRSLVIANASLTSHWTGWIEGSLHVASQTIQHVSSYYIPEKIPKNFARKAKPIDVSAYLNSKK